MTRRNTNSLNNQPIPKQKKREKYCGFCKSKSMYIDYKNPAFLKNFLNPQAKILPPTYTGNCRKHQKRVATAIKRARHLAFLPFNADNFK